MGAQKKVDPRHGLAAIYQAYKKFPKDKILKIKPEELDEMFKKDGMSSVSKGDGTIALLMVRAAHEVSQDEFVDALINNEIPAIKLSKHEMSVLSGGGASSFLLNWGAKIGGTSFKGQTGRSIGGGLISEGLGNVIDVIQAGVGIAGAVAAGGGAVAAGAGIAAMSTAAMVGGYVGKKIDNATGWTQKAGIGTQGTFANAFWTDVGKKIGYID